MSEEYIKDKSRGDKRKKDFRVAKNRSIKSKDENVHKYLKSSVKPPYSISKAKKLLKEKNINTENLSDKEILKLVEKYTTNINDLRRLNAASDRISDL